LETKTIIGIEYKMGGNSLNTAEREKDLGVWISKDLNATYQCIEVENKCNRLLGYIKRQFYYKNKTIVTTLYNTLIHKATH
jgi:hypothetical protein